jgi:serine/threonine-protein kinase
MLGAYRITGVLASGQMGIVYRAEHPSRRRPFAIKAVHGQHETNPAIVARFFAESVVLGRISHPNVVRFHDFGYDAAGSAYLVMELLEGETLTSRLARERRLDATVALDIALQVAQGLAAAHALGIVHRDLKPDNVFLCSNGIVKLLDFGVAKLEGQGPTHTLQGDLLGTAAYMAPEQGRSASDSDARSDLYSVGCMLFEMVCGVVPFPGSLVETLVAHQTAQRPPARALNASVTGELDALIDRLLARQPAARIQTALELVHALEALESTAQRRKRSPRSGTLLIDDHTGPVPRSVALSPVVMGLLATLLGVAISFLALR